MSNHSNPVPWQNWMAAYFGYTLQMKTLFRGWSVLIHDTQTRRLADWLSSAMHVVPIAAASGRSAAEPRGPSVFQMFLSREKLHSPVKFMLAAEAYSWRPWTRHTCSVENKRITKSHSYYTHINYNFNELSTQHKTWLLNGMHKRQERTEVGDSFPLINNHNFVAVIEPRNILEPQEIDRNWTVYKASDV